MEQVVPIKNDSYEIINSENLSSASSDITESSSVENHAILTCASTQTQPTKKKRIRKKKECPWIIYQIENIPRISKTNTSNVIPPNVKRDIRPELAFMWANTLNSYDSNQLLSFLHTFCVPNCVHIQKHIDNNLNELGLVFKAKGINEIALTTAMKLSMYPDISVIPSCVTVTNNPNYIRGSRVKGEGTFIGTRMFEGPDPCVIAKMFSQDRPEISTSLPSFENNVLFDNRSMINSIIDMKNIDMFKLKGRRVLQPYNVTILSKMIMHLDDNNRIYRLEYYDINAQITQLAL